MNRKIQSKELHKPTVFDQLVSSGSFTLIICHRLMSREKRKIVMKEGDADQFYVEKYIGYVSTQSAFVTDRIDLRIKLISRRRAVGRRPDGTSRIFEYLVKWLQWPTDTSTW